MAEESHPTWLLPKTEDLNHVAIKIWRSVVREALPSIPHYQHWIISKPANQVGGDFHLVSDDWIVIGDVSGKGISAALLTSMFMSALKLALRHPDPAKALEHALFNELERAEMFTTLAAIRLGADGWLDYINLGHPPILIIKQNKGLLEALKASAPPIGTIPLDNYPRKSVKLEPGDLICLYTDGLIDAERKAKSSVEFFGLERLTSLLSKDFTQPPSKVFEALTSALSNWQLNDDLTLILLQYQPEHDWLKERLDRR